MRRINREMHGKSNTPSYAVWACMKNRCYNKNDADYKYYGGRGITIYYKWINSFESYLSFVSKLLNYGTKGYSLDRIDNDKGYFPYNLKYSTISEQRLNRRTWGKSKYKGVGYSYRDNIWRASGKTIDGKRLYLGCFKTENEAYKAILDNNRRLIG